MKYTALNLLILLLCFSFCSGQKTDTARNNAISIELGKTGLIFNLGFDHRFAGGKYGFRVIAGSNFVQYLKAITAGAGGYRLFGKQKHFFELGLDIQYLSVEEISDDQKWLTLIYPDYSIKTAYPSLNLGYRGYMKRSLFRIGFSPGLISDELIPGGYISFGLRF